KFCGTLRRADLPRIIHFVYGCLLRIGLNSSDVLRGHGDKCTKKSIAGILGNVAELGAHRLGKRFVVRADEKLTAFVELGNQQLRHQSIKSKRIASELAASMACLD